MVQTAEEFWETTSPDEKYGMLAELKKLGLHKHVFEAMERFTELHVTEALKQAGEAADDHAVCVGMHYAEYDGLVDSILNAYPLDLIK